MRVTSASKISSLLRSYAMQRPDRIPEQWEVADGNLSNFHKWANGRPTKGAFRFQLDRGDAIWLAVTDWKNDNNFYVVLFPGDRNGPIAELHQVVDGVSGPMLLWTYSPSLRDGRNHLRRDYFEALYGSRDVFVSIPNNIGQVDDFLEQLSDLAVNRREADSLPAAAPRRRDDFPEGKVSERLHLSRERSNALIREAKSRVLAGGNRLLCECCGFDFELTYGKIGKEFIEGHHTKPISELHELGETTNVEDIALVCSNCHRMLHRKRPWLTRERLRALIK